jgi:hypothetical protein
MQVFSLFKGNLIFFFQIVLLNFHVLGDLVVLREYIPVKLVFVYFSCTTYSKLVRQCLNILALPEVLGELEKIQKLEITFLRELNVVAWIIKT